jgi:hypothetical protein
MSSKTENFHKLCDQNGKQILRYPKNTLLDGIISDLWKGEIRKYLSCPPFMFGTTENVYPGYRKMTNDEFHKIKAKFVFHYKNQEIAIANNIDNMNNYYLGISDEVLVLHGGESIGDKFPALGKEYRLFAKCLSLCETKYHYNIAIIMIFDPLYL